MMLEHELVIHRQENRKEGFDLCLIQKSATNRSQTKVKYKTIKSLGNKTWDNLHSLGLGKEFSDLIPKPQS